MLGKVLRKPELHPALSSLVFASDKIQDKEIKGRRGRPRKNLYDTILNDPRKYNLDLDSARDAAKDNKGWENLLKSEVRTRKSQRLASNRTKP